MLTVIQNNQLGIKNENLNTGGGAVVNTAASQEEGSGFESWLVFPVHV